MGTIDVTSVYSFFPVKSRLATTSVVIDLYKTREE
jgi:hypothetical protein